MKEDRYRKAEADLFEDAGILPVERWLDLQTIGVRTRVLEVGEGVPVVFLHGGPMAGATWSYVAAALTGVRAILVDRPGCGLSAPPRQIPGSTSVAAYVEQLTGDLLDALELTKATLVGSSFGGYSALRSARALPGRVTGVYVAGCPPFIPGWTQIPYFTALRAPLLGRLMVTLPATRTSSRFGLRQMGHARTLEAATIPEPMLRWEVAWQRYTDTVGNDATMIRRCGTFRRGFEPALDLRADDLARIKAPVHVLAGTADPIGGEALGRTLVESLPDATLEVWEDAGHLPWLDDPERMATSLQKFVGR